MYEKQIEALNPWFYELEVYGYLTRPGIGSTVDTESLLNRQRGRYTLLVDELTKRYDFADKSILDIACNCGYWSSLYIKHYNASSVFGIDGRSIFLQQANLYYKSLGIRDKAEFLHANVELINYDELPGFDFVVCAGILYHIKDYKSLLEKVSRINTEAMIVDTRIAVHDQFRREPGDLYFNAIEESRDKITPGRNSLIRHLLWLGYDIEVLRPTFQSVKGLQDGDDYNADRRICIFCKK